MQSVRISRRAVSNSASNRTSVVGTPLPFPRCSMFDSYRGRFYRVPELTRRGNVDPRRS
jgi:hypothetical protein